MNVDNNIQNGIDYNAIVISGGIDDTIDNNNITTYAGHISYVILDDVTNTTVANNASIQYNYTDVSNISQINDTVNSAIANPVPDSGNVATQAVPAQLALQGALTAGFDPYSILGSTPVEVTSGEISSGIIVNGGAFYAGSLQVDAGGTAVGATVSNAVANIYGVASGETIGGGAAEYVQAGGATVSSIVGQGGFEAVNSGGVASATTVAAGGEESVYSGGVAIGTTVLSGGLEFLASAATASGVTVMSGASLELFADVMSGTTLSVGSSIVSGTTLISGVTVESGGQIELANTTIETGGQLALASGGLLNGIVTISSGAVLSGVGSTGAETLDFGTVDGVALYGDGFLVVESGGVASGVGASGQWVEVASGGVASATTVGLSMTVDAGGMAAGTTIISGGSAVVNGEAVGSLVQSGGLETVQSGALSISAVVAAGGVEAVSAGGRDQRRDDQRRRRDRVFGRLRDRLGDRGRRFGPGLRLDDRNASRLGRRRKRHVRRVDHRAGHRPGRGRAGRSRRRGLWRDRRLRRPALGSWNLQRQRHRVFGGCPFGRPVRQWGDGYPGSRRP